MELTSNSLTEQATTRYLDNPSHALLVVGPAGVGKQAILNHIASKLLSSELSQHAASLKTVNPSDGTITIDMIRDVTSFIKLKKQGHRVVAIHNAQRMNAEAQNSLLKLLEEPPQDVFILLSVDSESSLRKTIISRTEKMVVRPLTKEELMGYLQEQKVDSAEQQAIWAMSSGRLELAQKLLDPTSSERETFMVAKHLVQSSTFDRLLNVDSLSKKQDTLPLLLFAISRVIRLSAKSQSALRLQESLQTIYDCQSALESSNPNTKLLLTKLMIGI